MLIALLPQGSASSGNGGSQVLWPAEPLICACWWLWEMGFNDLNHSAHSTIYTCHELITQKKQFSLLFSSRLLVAVKSENMRLCGFKLYSILSNQIWKSVKNNITLSGHDSKNPQTWILMPEALVNI